MDKVVATLLVVVTSVATVFFVERIPRGVLHLSSVAGRVVVVDGLHPVDELWVLDVFFEEGVALGDVDFFEWPCPPRVVHENHLGCHTLIGCREHIDGAVYFIVLIVEHSDFDATHAHSVLVEGDCVVFRYSEGDRRALFTA